MRVCITIPVFNEENKLRNCITRLHAFLTAQFRHEWEIVIANNGSTDRTLELAKSLAQEFPGVCVAHLDRPGRGQALKQVWLESDADILSYMDADLSSDLEAFPRLIEAVASGGYDVATGSRMLDRTLTTRSLKRELTSRCYNFLVKTLLRTHFSDAQCGFKALTRQAAQRLLPLVEDNGWFFDTELLVLAEKLGYSIFDLPVRWVEDRDSRVRVVATAAQDLKGLVRLRRKFGRTDVGPQSPG